MKIDVTILGVGLEMSDETSIMPNRWLLELPKEVTDEMNDILLKHFPNTNDIKKYIVAKTDFNYKKIQ